MSVVQEELFTPSLRRTRPSVAYPFSPVSFTSSHGSINTQVNACENTPIPLRRPPHAPATGVVSSPSTAVRDFIALYEARWAPRLAEIGDEIRAAIELCSPEAAAKITLQLPTLLDGLLVRRPRTDPIHDNRARSSIHTPPPEQCISNADSTNNDLDTSVEAVRSRARSKGRASLIFEGEEDDSVGVDVVDDLVGIGEPDEAREGSDEEEDTGSTVSSEAVVGRKRKRVVRNVLDGDAIDERKASAIAVEAARALIFHEDGMIKIFYDTLQQFFEAYLSSSGIVISPEEEEKKEMMIDAFEALVRDGLALVGKLQWDRSHRKGSYVRSRLVPNLAIFYFEDVIRHIRPRRLFEERRQEQLVIWRKFYMRRSVKQMSPSDAKAHWRENCCSWWKGKPLC